MKIIENTDAKPLMSGTDVPVNMGISDDPDDQLMILNVLSNTLYTDKIAAVIREYACNACDANVEAGRGDTPIEVRLPNKLDPTIAIRDFGFGMSEQQILNVFCRLGRSTKRGSNDFTGMLGIGSKAGFAYGDSFTVTSWNGGLKTIYTAYRAKGRPMLAKMGESPSEGADGIEVLVPVRLPDVVEFVCKAEKILRYFRVRPIIKGATFEWVSRDSEFRGANWRYTGNGASVAIMGNVGYTIDPAVLNSAYDAKLSTLIALGVELDFNIGDLEIAANREGLQYQDHTRMKLNASLLVVATEISKVFTDRIATAKTCWEAHRMYSDNFEKLGSDSYGKRTLKAVVDGNIMWKGQKITSGRMDINPLDRQTGALKWPGVSITQYARSSYYRKGMTKIDRPEYVQASEKSTLVINDLPSKTNSPSRVKGFFTHDLGKDSLTIFVFADTKTQDAFWKAKQLDGVTPVKLSSITPALSASGSRGGSNLHRAKHSAKVFTLANTTAAYGPESSHWDSAAVDLQKDGGTYVIIDRFMVQSPDGGYSIGAGQFQKQVAELRKAGLITGDVYGFKLALTPKLGPLWVRFEKSLASRVSALSKSPKFLQEVADFYERAAYNDLLDILHRKQFGAHSKMHKLLTEVERMGKPAAGASVLKFINDGRAKPWVTTTTLTLPRPTVQLKKMDEEVLDTYPLLDHISRHNLCSASSKLVTFVAEYVKMINK